MLKAILFTLLLATHQARATEGSEINFQAQAFARCHIDSAVLYFFSPYGNSYGVFFSSTRVTLLENIKVTHPTWVTLEATYQFGEEIFALEFSNYERVSTGTLKTLSSTNEKKVLCELMN